MTPAARARRYRQRHGATDKPGRPVTQPCGTVSAYKRHLRHGEPTCAACRAAWAAWMKAHR
jgi:hypothetical protein